MNRREFLILSSSAAALLPVVSFLPEVLKRDPLQEGLWRLQRLVPNGIVKPPVFQVPENALRAEYLADAFSLVERYDLQVDGVFCNPLDWVTNTGLDSCLTRVVDPEGGMGAKLWGARIWTHREVPLGTVYVVSEKGLRTLTDQGTTRGLSLIQLLPRGRV